MRLLHGDPVFFAHVFGLFIKERAHRFGNFSLVEVGFCIEHSIHDALNFFRELGQLLSKLRFVLSRSLLGHSSRPSSINVSDPFAEILENSDQLRIVRLTCSQIDFGLIGKALVKLSLLLDAEVLPFIKRLEAEVFQKGFCVLFDKSGDTCFSRQLHQVFKIPVAHFMGKGGQVSIRSQVDCVLFRAVAAALVCSVLEVNKRVLNLLRQLRDGLSPHSLSVTAEFYTNALFFQSVNQFFGSVVRQNRSGKLFNVRLFCDRLCADQSDVARLKSIRKLQAKLGKNFRRRNIDGLRFNLFGLVISWELLPKLD